MEVERIEKEKDAGKEKKDKIKEKKINNLYLVGRELKFH